MANDYTQTDNYGLSLYGDQSPADLRDGHNNNMRIIDQQLKTTNDATAKGTSAKNILDHIGWTDNDKAADWINNAEQNETQTTANTNALTALGAETTEKATKINNIFHTDPIYYGADPTGTNDSTTAIQTAIDNSIAGIHISTGIYKISKPINIPYNTQAPFNITLDTGATIIATAAMPQMFNIGADKRADTGETEGFTLTGGHFNANSLAEKCIYTSPNIRQSRINNVDLKYFTKVGIHIDSAKNNSSDTVISNIRINRVQTPNSLPNTIGVQFSGNDNIIGTAYICDTQTGIQTEGYLQADNIHIFMNNKYSNINTIGIDGNNGANLTNIYVDSCKIGIRFLGTIQISTLYMYNYYAQEGRCCIQAQSSNLNATNVKVEGNICDVFHPIDSNKEETNPNSVVYTYTGNGNTSSTTDYTNYISGNQKINTYYINTLSKDLNKNQGILIAYLLYQNVGFLGMMIGSINVPKGYEFNFPSTYSDLISGDNLPKINNNNYGLLLGETTTVNKLTVRPLYLYRRNKLNYDVNVQITLSEIHYQGLWIINNNTVYDMTTINKIATTNDNNDL